MGRGHGKGYMNYCSDKVFFWRWYGNAKDVAVLFVGLVSLSFSERGWPVRGLSSFAVLLCDIYHGMAQKILLLSLLCLGRSERRTAIVPWIAWPCIITSSLILRDRPPIPLFSSSHVSHRLRGQSRETDISVSIITSA